MLSVDDLSANYYIVEKNIIRTKRRTCTVEYIYERNDVQT